MSAISKPTREALAAVRLRSPLTLFVCRDCPLGKQRRGEFRAALKASGKNRQVRVVACRCLDVCPKRGTTTVLASAAAPARCAVVDTAADAAAALDALLDERVGDPVPD